MLGTGIAGSRLQLQLFVKLSAITLLLIKLDGKINLRP
jgi:hypothetical protein